MYCKKCGTKINEDASFCSHCGRHVDKYDEKGTKSFYKVNIKRESQWFAVNPKLNMNIDSENNYKIDNGETLELNLEQGNHRISLSLGPRNKVVDILLDKDLSLIVKYNRLIGSIEIKGIR